VNDIRKLAAAIGLEEKAFVALFPEPLHPSYLAIGLRIHLSTLFPVAIVL
jgi:hypothetical protein